MATYGGAMHSAIIRRIDKLERRAIASGAGGDATPLTAEIVADWARWMEEWIRERAAGEDCAARLAMLERQVVDLGDMVGTHVRAVAMPQYWD